MTETKTKLYHCLNPECRKTVERKPSAVEPSGRVFCSHHCRALVNNPLRAKPKLQCARPECSNLFFYWANGKYCSDSCYRQDSKGKTKYTKDLVLEAIQKFVKKSERIPFKREMNPFYRPARRFFGNWNNAIKVAGFDPNPVMFANHFVAKDGHNCDSLSEKIIDDWFFKHNIPHQVHIYYPWKNNMKVDFKVDDYWIELFGLVGQHNRYDKLKKEKLALIEQHKLKLISLYLSDVFNPDKLLKKLNPLLQFSQPVLVSK